jgi:hypothetical protein
MTETLPSVCRQRRLARLAQPCAILLQASQHDLVTIIEMRAAEPRGIAPAGILPLLLRPSACGGQQNKGNGEEKSGHRIMPSYPAMKAF